MDTRLSRKRERPLDPQELLDSVVKSGVAVIVQPPMPLAAFEELMVPATLALAGAHEKKSRGTFQRGTLATFAARASPLGEFFRDVDACAASHGRVVNSFGNVNEGATGDVDDEGGGGKGGWHGDYFTVGVNMRIIFYYTEVTSLGRLSVRAPGGASAGVLVPRGCALLATADVLAKNDDNREHRHSVKGRSVTIVVEIERAPGAVLASASPAAIAAAAAAQPPLPLTARLTPFDLEKLFLGPKQNWGADRGGGTAGRVIMSALRGPVLPQRAGGRREMTKVEARAIKGALDPDSAEYRALLAVPIMRRWEMKGRPVSANFARGPRRDECVMIDGESGDGKGRGRGKDVVLRVWTVADVEGRLAALDDASEAAREGLLVELEEEKGKLNAALAKKSADSAASGA